MKIKYMQNVIFRKSWKEIFIYTEVCSVRMGLYWKGS